MGTVSESAATGRPSSWTWPSPPLWNRYNASVTEVIDLASGGRRVAVIDGALWPAVGSDITVYEDDSSNRQGTVVRVELVLGFRAPARVLIWVDLH
jgi:hypothetical protein